MAVLKFSTMDDGEQCAMIAGISMMLMWYVASSASLVQPLLILEQSTVRGLVLSGWMMSPVKEKRHRYLTVLIMGGARIIVFVTVVTTRMQGWSASKIRTESNILRFYVM